MSGTGPRPYGRGPYGAGLYSRYGAAIWQFGGRSGIRFHAEAPARYVQRRAAKSAIVFHAKSIKPEIVYALAARPHIRFTARALPPPITIFVPHARSRIAWRIVAVGPRRVMRPAARTRIRFHVTAEPVWNWRDRPAICAPADWTPAVCNPADWAEPGPCVVGSWGGVWLPNVRLPR